MVHTFLYQPDESWVNQLWLPSFKILLNHENSNAPIVDAIVLQCTRLPCCNLFEGLWKDNSNYQQCDLLPSTIFLEESNMLHSFVEN
jgi:hypothetical protein